MKDPMKTLMTIVAVAGVLALLALAAAVVGFGIAVNEYQVTHGEVRPL